MLQLRSAAASQNSDARALRFLHIKAHLPRDGFAQALKSEMLSGNRTDCRKKEKKTLSTKVP